MFFKRSEGARKLESIPVGHYHDVMLTGHPVRRAWHRLKFTRVLELLPRENGQSILDIGCFAGTFLSIVDEQRFTRQVGVDILAEQVQYAQDHFGDAHRKFVHVQNVREIDSKVEGQFDNVTLIEVIEHLTPSEIDETLKQAAKKLRPGGRLVMSTPNYASTWPALEVALNKMSDVTYDEQHITRFTYFDAEKKLANISSAIRDDFQFELKTTTHLVSPFLAVLGVDFASRVSSLVGHKSWKMPFGNLVMLSYTRR